MKKCACVFMQDSNPTVLLEQKQMLYAPNLHAQTQCRKIPAYALPFSLSNRISSL